MGYLTILDFIADIISRVKSRFTTSRQANSNSGGLEILTSRQKFSQQWRFWVYRFNRRQLDQNCNYKEIMLFFRGLILNLKNSFVNYDTLINNILCILLIGFY